MIQAGYRYHPPHSAPIHLQNSKVNASQQLRFGKEEPDGPPQPTPEPSGIWNFIQSIGTRIKAMAQGIWNYVLSCFFPADKQAASTSAAASLENRLVTSNVNENPGIFIQTRSYDEDYTWTNFTDQDTDIHVAKPPQANAIKSLHGLTANADQPNLVVALDLKGRACVTVSGLPSGRKVRRGPNSRIKVVLVSPNNQLTALQKSLITGYLGTAPRILEEQPGLLAEVIQEKKTGDPKVDYSVYEYTVNQESLEQRIEQWGQSALSQLKASPSNKATLKERMGENSTENRAILQQMLLNTTRLEGNPGEAFAFVTASTSGSVAEPIIQNKPVKWALLPSK